MYVGSLILLNGYPSEDVPAGPAHLVQGVCPAGQHLRAMEERHETVQPSLHLPSQLGIDIESSLLASSTALCFPVNHSVSSQFKLLH